MKTGFIGLGIMGGRMAANLQKKGYELVVYNRNKHKADQLVAAGAEWADTPAELAGQVQVIITMLATPGAVEETALTGKDPFLKYLAPNSLWIDCSTVNPSFSRRMANEAGQRHIRFLDAPVAGSKIPAEQGQLLFFVGGAKDDIDKARPIFETMGKAIHHIGGHGMGTSMKMVNNLMLAQSMIAFSEAIVLGRSLRIPGDILFNTLLSSPVSAPFLSLKRSGLESGNYDPEFPLKWMYKDGQLLSESAYEVGAALPMANLAKEIVALAVRKGLGDQDFSAIYELLKETKGATPSSS